MHRRCNYQLAKISHTHVNHHWLFTITACAYWIIEPDGAIYSDQRNLCANLNVERRRSLKCLTNHNNLNFLGSLCMRPAEYLVILSPLTKGVESIKYRFKFSTSMMACLNVLPFTGCRASSPIIKIGNHRHHMDETTIVNLKWIVQTCFASWLLPGEPLRC